jgi:hypothetical protein
VDLGGHRGNLLGERCVGLYEISQPTALLLDVATLRVGNPGDMVGGSLVTVGLAGLSEQDQRRRARGLRGRRRD